MKNCLARSVLCKTKTNTCKAQSNAPETGAIARLNDTIGKYNNTKSDTGSLLKHLVLRAHKDQMDERFINVVAEALSEQNKLDDEFTKHIHKDPYLVDTR